MAIPITLLIFVRRRHDLPFPWLFVMFGMFIVACGFTHLFDVWTFYHPMYRAAGLMKLITAVISMATVAALVPVLPRALAIPRQARLAGELQQEVIRREQITSDLEQERQRLRAEISERRRAEERFRRTVESSPNAMLMIDPRGSVVLVNEQAERLFGYRREELIGRSADELLSPAGTASSAGARPWDGKPDFLGPIPASSGTEFVGRHRDGRDIAILLAWNTIEEEDGVHTLAAIIDIADRKKVEATLEESAARMHAILHTAVDGIVTIDARGIIETINRAGLRMFGYEEPDVIGKNVSMLMPPPYRNEHDGYLANYLRTRHAKVIGIEREAVGLRKDGQTFPIDLAVSEVLFGDRRLFTGVVRDISERKTTKQELERQGEELRGKNDALCAVNAELARKNAELDSFTYVASHDLQEPLRKLTSFSKLLEMDLGGDLSATVQKDLDFISDAASRMQTLVRDVLHLSRAGNSEMRREPVALSKCVDDAVAAIAAAIEESGAEIGRDPLPTVIGDPVLLTQVFQNLLSNAVKFVAPGRKPVMHVTASGNGDGWVFGVRDNGIGIPAEHQQEVFAPFRRLHGRMEYPGTGIGLAICRRAVERHEGTIWVESVPGGGTHIRFTIGILTEAVHAGGDAATARGSSHR